MLGGVLDRHPKLRFFFAESGIGWLPYWMEQMDDRFNRHRFWAKVRLAKTPSTYVREHVAFSFQEDHAGVALRHSIGIDNICWASDFPHSVGDWPWSRETRERQFAKLPSDERRKIEALNIACHLGVITKAEKEVMAKLPRSEPPVAAQARGTRRM
jgi:predicted TIM-barrel fold metal-dependent hydrolase